MLLACEKKKRLQAETMFGIQKKEGMTEPTKKIQSLSIMAEAISGARGDLSLKGGDGERNYNVKQEDAASPPGRLSLGVRGPKRAGSVRGG